MTDQDDEIGDTGDMLQQSAGGFGSGGIADRDTGGTTDTTDTTDTEETTGTTDTTETTETTGTTPQPGDPEFSFKDQWAGRTLYLPPELAGEVDQVYKRLDVDWSAIHGDDLPKNERFYPAVFRVAIQNPDLLRTELGLDD